MALPVLAYLGYLGTAALLGVLASGCNRNKKPSEKQVKYTFQDVYVGTPPDHIYKSLLAEGVSLQQMDRGTPDHPKLKGDRVITEEELIQTARELYQAHPENASYKNLVEETLKGYAKDFYTRGYGFYGAPSHCVSLMVHDKILLYDPDYYRSLLGLGICRKNPEYLRKAIKLEPAQMEPYLSLSKLLLAQGKAREALEVARSYHPGKPPILESQARALLATGKKKEAWETFQKAARHYKSDQPHHHLILGRGHFQLGEPDKALVELKKALGQLIKENPKPRSSLAYEVFVSLGDVHWSQAEKSKSKNPSKYQNALSAYRQATQSNTTDPRGHMGLAKVYLKLGRYYEADLTLVKAERDRLGPRDEKFHDLKKETSNKMIIWALKKGQANAKKAKARQ